MAILRTIIESITDNDYYMAHIQAVNIQISMIICIIDSDVKKIIAELI